MIMSFLYGFIIAFFVLNTISFYVMDFVSDRLMLEKSSELTKTELVLYTYLRILTGGSIVGIAVSVIWILSQRLLNLF